MANVLPKEPPPPWLNASQPGAQPQQMEMTRLGEKKARAGPEFARSRGISGNDRTVSFNLSSFDTRPSSAKHSFLASDSDQLPSRTISHHRGFNIEVKKNENPDVAKKRAIADFLFAKEKEWYIIHPMSFFRRTWDALCVALVMFIVITVPLALAFPSTTFDYSQQGKQWNGLFYTIDAYFWCDIVLNFFTGFEHDGHQVTQPKKIVKHYLKGWFIIDLIGSLPFEYMGTGAQSSDRKAAKFVKLFKLARLLRVGRVVRYLRGTFRYRYLAVMLCVWLVYLHTGSCLWFGLITVYDGDTRYSKLQNSTIDFTPVYLANLNAFVAHNLLMDRLPAISSQTMGYSFCCMLIGALFLGLLYGVMAKFLMQLLSPGDQFRTQIDTVKQEMARLELSGALQKRVSQHYDYLWMRHIGHEADGEVLLGDPNLSLTLRAQISMELAAKRVPLRKLAMFNEASDACVAALALTMKMHVFLPGDYICIAGDPVCELFYIKKGNLGVSEPATADPLHAALKNHHLSQNQARLRRRKPVAAPRDPQPVPHPALRTNTSSYGSNANSPASSPFASRGNSFVSRNTSFLTSFSKTADLNAVKHRKRTLSQKMQSLFTSQSRFQQGLSIVEASGEKIVRIYDDKQFYGEQLFLVPNAVRSCTLRAITTVELLVLVREEMLEVLDDYNECPEIVQALQGHDSALAVPSFPDLRLASLAEEPTSDQPSSAPFSPSASTPYSLQNDAESPGRPLPSSSVVTTTPGDCHQDGGENCRDIEEAGGGSAHGQSYPAPAELQPSLEPFVVEPEPEPGPESEPEPSPPAADPSSIYAYISA